jgi:N-acetyl-gamma-glutamyl-phosphate reductase
MITAAVAGASGYAGGELLRILSAHPDIEVIAATAHTNAGQRVGSVHPQLRSLAAMELQETTPRILGSADVVFLALPHGASGDLVQQLPAEQRIVDLGADFRLKDPEVYERYYGGTHHGTWTYGLPELAGQREKIAGSTRVANTGCYAVTIISALAPLIAAGLADPDDVVVVAASGTSGAGRSAKLNLLGAEVMGDLSPYKVGAHQHVPEILQATGARSLSMTPILAPMPRGILASVTSRPLTTGITVDDVRAVLAKAYDDEPFIHLLPEGEQPHTAAVFGSNSIHLQVSVDVSSGRIIVMSASDNLVKGAAGQAVQNANIILGLPETAGLAIDGIAP